MSSKIAIVTGGSRGLGKNRALSIAGKGVSVILTYHSRKAEADEVVKQIESGGQKPARPTITGSMRNGSKHPAACSFNKFLRLITR